MSLERINRGLEEKSDIVRARRVILEVWEAEVRSKIASKVHMHFKGRNISVTCIYELTL